MAEIIDFSSRGTKSKQSVDDGSARAFVGLIRSDRVSDLTQATIADTIRSPEYVTPDIGASIGIIDGDIEYGTCYIGVHSAAASSRRFLITHSNFPKYLADSENFDDQDNAHVAAAVYVRSFELISAAFVQGRARWYRQLRARLAQTNVHDKYWQTNMKQNIMRAEYRAAGLIALKAVQMDPSNFDLAAEPPYPPHIAGFMDSLPVRSSSLAGNKSGLLDLKPLLEK